MQLASLLPHFAAAQPLYGLGLDTTLAEEKAAPPKHWLFILILFLLFSTSYFVLIFNRALIELELETNTCTVLKFYWPNQQGNYSEKHVAKLLIKPSEKHYAVRVTNLSQLDHLRFDPTENKAAQITVRRITVQQSGFPLYQLHSPADFAAQLQVMADVDNLTLLPEGGIQLQISKPDAQLKLALPHMERHIPWLKELQHGLLILLLAAGCYGLSRLFAQWLDFIPVLAVFVLALILVMAVISAYNTHPDESVHVAASEYYTQHNLPPKIGDPAITHTYSAYGVSRLHSGEIYYLVAGKYLRFLNPFQLEPYLALRLLNVFLFLALPLCAFRQTAFRSFLLVVLLSPQIWYIFSYVDSEGLALVICLFAAYQLAVVDSSLNCLLRDEPARYGWLTSLWLGLLFGLLLLQKQNFYFLYVFFLLYFLWRIRVAPVVWSKRMLARFITIIMTGSLLITAVLVTDAWINEFRKGELTLAAREQYAETIYKPSTPLKEKHLYLQLRDRGISLWHMLTVERWAGKSFRTAFGVYGYTQYSAPFVYYDYVQTLGLLLLLTLIVSVVWRGGWAGLTLLGIAGGWTVFFLAGLIHHAWTVDFQAQGRYLLPMVPMLAMLYYHCQQLVIRPIFSGVFFLLFLLSVYNFVFVGLHDIGKVVL